MRYAILADIHSNLEALEAVLRDAKGQRVTHHVCLGDIVGYNADPQACLEIVRVMGMPTVKGNHDEYCSADIELDRFYSHSAKVVSWTRNQLSDDDCNWLRELRYIRLVADFTIVHATLDGPQRWGYLFDKLAAAASFPYQNTPVCFFGHTHVPVAFIKTREVRGGTFTKFKIEKDRKYFINAGSVGQPRDGNPKAGYVIYDLDEQTVELRRLDYDIEKTQAKVRAAGLSRRPSDDEGEAGAAGVIKRR